MVGTADVEIGVFFSTGGGGGSGRRLIFLSRSSRKLRPNMNWLSLRVPIANRMFWRTSSLMAMNSCTKYFMPKPYARTGALSMEPSLSMNMPPAPTVKKGVKRFLGKKG